MIKYILSLFLPFAIWSTVMAQVQTEEPVVAEQSSDGKLENALLWKIEGDNVKGASYLFGTIHLIEQEEYFLPPGTENAINASETMVFEIDMAEMTDMGAQLSIFAKAFMKGGVRLKDLLTEEDYAVVKTHFETMGLPLFMLERIKPMFLSIFATGDFSAEDLMGGGSTTSYEMEFYQLANEREMGTGGLETMEFQLAVFDSIPYEAQAEMLVETIKMGDEGDEQFEEMMRMYKGQDVDGLYDMTTGSESDLGEYEDILLDKRNTKWISGMAEYMAAGPTFFAVGAAHLGGPIGVIRLLREQGYDVTPVLKEGKSRRVKRI